MREKQQQCGTPLNLLLTLKSFTVKRDESSANAGQKVETGKNISEEFTVRQKDVDLALL